MMRDTHSHIHVIDTQTLTHSHIIDRQIDRQTLTHTYHRQTDRQADIVVSRDNRHVCLSAAMQHAATDI